MRIDCIYLNTCPIFLKKSTSHIIICIFYKKKRNVANGPGLYKNKNKKTQHRHTHTNCRFVHIALFTSRTGSPGHRAQQLPLSHAPPQPWTLGTAQGAAGAAALLAGSASALPICRRRSMGRGNGDPGRAEGAARVWRQLPEGRLELWGGVYMSYFFIVYSY